MLEKRLLKQITRCEAELGTRVAPRREVAGRHPRLGFAPEELCRIRFRRSITGTTKPSRWTTWLASVPGHPSPERC